MLISNCDSPDLHKTQPQLCASDGVTSPAVLSMFLCWVSVLVSGNTLPSFLAPHCYAPANFVTGDLLRSTHTTGFPVNSFLCVFLVSDVPSTLFSWNRVLFSVLSKKLGDSVCMELVPFQPSGRTSD